MTDEDFTWEKQAEYADELVRELMRDGMDIQKIMNMPYHYLIDIMNDKAKPKKEKSLIAAFSGN